MHPKSSEDSSNHGDSVENSVQNYYCTVCGYHYPSNKVPFPQLPADWRCPVCRTGKSEFRLL